MPRMSCKIDLGKHPHSPAQHATLARQTKTRTIIIHSATTVADLRAPPTCLMYNLLIIPCDKGRY